MPSGSHPPCPCQKPNLVASCNLQAATHVAFVTNLRQSSCRRLAGAECTLQTSRRRLQQSSLSPTRHRETPVHNATELPFAHPIWPFSEGSQFACLSDKHMQVPWRAKGVHLHENWACGTMKPPIREPAAVSLQPGRSDMSNIPTLANLRINLSSRPSASRHFAFSLANEAKEETPNEILQQNSN